MRDRLMLTDAERAELQQIELQLRNESTAENARAALEMRQAEIQQRDPALKQLRDQLESQLEGWTRGNVKVALVGRVPVRVTGPVQAGDYLTTSNIPGVAMAMTQPGPSIGIALEDFDGVGEGKVVTVIQPGYHAPQGAALASAPAQPAADVALLDATIIAQQEQIDQLSVENAELRDRLLQLEAAVDVLLQH